MSERPDESELQPAEVYERPAVRGGGEPVWQAEIQVPQGGSNHSGRPRLFAVRAPPRKTKELAEEDSVALTDAARRGGAKEVRALANKMHR